MEGALFNHAWKSFIAYSRCAFQTSHPMHPTTRRVDASTASRAKLSREEVELMDVAAEMEQQLVQQYTQVREACRGRGRGIGGKIDALRRTLC